MTSEDLSGRLVRPFPKPGPRIRLAYRDLARAIETVSDDPTRIDGFRDLPRPWIPASCEKSELREEVWGWLERVVIWLNHEYVYDPSTAIPACWPEHAHLVHEIACLADQRFRAESALTSDPLEHWHFMTYPAFIDRMLQRVGESCEAGHPEAWPAAARFRLQVSSPMTRRRSLVFASDLGRDEPEGPEAPSLRPFEPLHEG